MDTHDPLFSLDIFGSHLPLPAPRALVVLACTAQNSGAPTAIHGAENGGLWAEKKRRIHLLAYSFYSIDR